MKKQYLKTLKPIHKLSFMGEIYIYLCNPSIRVNVFKTDTYSKLPISCKNCLKCLAKAERKKGV